MYRMTLGLLGSTLLAIPTMVPNTATVVTPQVLHSPSQPMFAMPVNYSKEVAPAKDESRDMSTLADPTVRSNSPTAYGSSGGSYTSSTSSTGGYGSSGGYGSVYGPARTFNRVRRIYVPSPVVTTQTTYNTTPCNCACGCPGGPNCPCGGNCGCPDCNCGNSQYADNDVTDAVYTGPVVLARRVGPIRRLLNRRRTLVAQSSSCSSCGSGAWRSSACPSCGN